MERAHFIKAAALISFTLQTMKLNDLKNITDEFKSNDLMPILFMGHGLSDERDRRQPFLIIKQLWARYYNACSDWLILNKD